MSLVDPDLEGIPQPGTMLGGKYQIFDIIGRGGMGVVVSARHLRLKRDVALKVLLPALRGDPNVVARFEREGRAASQLLNPHVARVLDVDALPDGTPFIVMEMLRGKDLNDILVERGPLPYREAVGYLLEACAGMVDAHKAGIVHRDLKPNNLFLDQQTGKSVLKILDFGISKVSGDENQSMTATSTAFGTPLYMSPEQVRSTKHVDQRADIWSLGVVLYELLCGETPFSAPAAPAIIAGIIADKAPPIGDRRPDLPPQLAAAVMRSLAKDPNERYPDVIAFAAALAPFAPDGAAFAPPPSSMLSADRMSAPASTNMPLGARTIAPSNARQLVPIIAGMSIAIVFGSILLVVALKRRSELTALAERTAISAAPTPTVAPAATLAVPTATPTVAPSGEPEPAPSGTSAKPRQKPLPTDKATPVDKPISADKPVQVDKPPPVDKPAPKDKPAPVDKPAPPQNDDPKYLP